jgi:glucose dehydrogenase
LQHLRVTPKWFIIIVLMAFTSLAPALTLAQTPVAAPGAAPVGEPAGAEWTTYGGNLYNQRYSSLDQINKDTVKDLKGAWVYHTNI